MKTAFMIGLLAQASADNLCRWDTGNGVTYDVSSLSQTVGAYIWNDPTDLYTSNSTYTFNVCANVPANMVPAGCSTKKNSPAWQVDDSGSCYALGSDLISYGHPAMQVDYADPLDYARGVKFTFLGGDVGGGCPTNINGGSRAFSLVMMCSLDKPFPAPALNPSAAPDTSDSYIDEVDTCIYTAYSRSMNACPTQCPIYNGQVCGGNGVCGYDSTAQSARCFCYDGFIEAGCQTEQYPFPSGSVAGALFGGIFVGALGVLGYAYYAGKKAAAHVSSGEGFY